MADAMRFDAPRDKLGRIAHAVAARRRARESSVARSADEQLAWLDALRGKLDRFAHAARRHACESSVARPANEQVSSLAQGAWFDARRGKLARVARIAARRRAHDSSREARDG